jgi:hypothetical protein
MLNVEFVVAAAVVAVAVVVAVSVVAAVADALNLAVRI